MENKKIESFSFSQGWQLRKREVIMFAIIVGVICLFAGVIMGIGIISNESMDLALRFLNADCPEIVKYLESVGGLSFFKVGR